MQNTNIKQTVGGASTTPATPAPKVEHPKFDGTADGQLKCAEYVLSAVLKTPAHHSLIIATARKLAIIDETVRTFEPNPKMWAEWRKDTDRSRFVLYGKSVFGLTAWAVPNATPYFPLTTAPEPYVPTASTNNRSAAPLTRDQVAVKIERLKAELAEAEAALKNFDKK